MDDYAGRVLADRYRLPLPPSDEYELTETRAFDTYSGQEVLVRQVPLPEVVEAEVLDAEGLPEGFTARERGARRAPDARTATRRPADPAVRRAVEAAQAAARIPDHPRLDQVFDVFAEGGSLWIVSEWVAARPLAAFLAEQPLSPYRAAEVASDVLMALRVLHAHGWVHRNITARTVLVCDDGRVMLTGLAVGAAEEALCGYDPVPGPDGPDAPDEGMTGAPGATGAERAEPGAGAGAGAGGFGGPGGGSGAPHGGSGGSPGPRGGSAGGPPYAGRPGDAPGHGGRPAGADGTGGVVGGSAGAGGVPSVDIDPESARRAAIQARAAGGLPEPGANGASGPAGQRALESGPSGADIRAARAGAIAAYRAGARAAARVQESQQTGRPALPGARPSGEGGTGADRGDGGEWPSYPDGRGSATPTGRTDAPYGVQESQQTGRPALPGARPSGEGGTGADRGDGGEWPSYPDGRGTSTPPGRAVGPYGAQGAPGHGASPRATGAGGGTSPDLGGAAQRPVLSSGDPGPGHAPVPGRTPAQDPDTAHRTDTGPGRQGSDLPPYGPGPAQGSGRSPYAPHPDRSG
ncbi:protein kinase, partial [Streptomyces sp. MMG1121]|uniref:protein kinase n=1 Tax=Streptomyces sp. MMG1121 TaxID=1415544 RepID=UPI001F2E61CE